MIPSQACTSLKQIYRIGRSLKFCGTVHMTSLTRIKLLIRCETIYDRVIWRLVETGHRYKTDERESPQEAKPARENSSLGFIEAVHQ